MNLAIGAVAISGAAAAAQAAEQPAKKPNVLFIAVDDLKPLLGCYGGTAKTPNIDRLAARGLVFMNNHCQQAVCGPTRASLMTGLRPDTTRVYDLKTKMRDINPDLVTIPQYFGTHGYTTTSIGKIHDGRCSDGWAEDDIKSWTNGRIRVQPNPNRVGEYADPQTVAEIRRLSAEHRAKELRGEAQPNPVALDPSTECIDVPDDTYGDGTIARTAVQTLRKLAAGDEPFFFGVGFSKPHLPFVAPKRYWDLYDRSQFQIHPYQQRPAGAPQYAWQDSWELRGRYTDIPKTGPIPAEKQLELIHGYHAAVSYMDSNVGLLLAELEGLGIADNTVIVLWGDHGFHLGDHGMFCKHTNYEQATRSPLIIAAPGLKPAKGSTNCPTEFVDIFPTLCNLAGLEAPKQLEGTSLVPLFSEPEKPVKAVAISQYPRYPDGKPAMGYAYRGQRYRYVEWVQKNFMAGEKSGAVVGVELYDYVSDPMETRNLAEDPAHAEVVAKFKQLVASGWRDLQGRGSDGL